MGLNQEIHHRLFAERLARLQSMEAFHKDKTPAVQANPNGGPLTFLHQHVVEAPLFRYGFGPFATV